MSAPRLTAKEYLATVAATPKGKGNKYGARKEVVDGFTFDSGAEAKHYGILKLRVRAKEITDLKLQVPFVLLGADGKPLKSKDGRTLRYRADFTYIEVATQQLVIVDVKGAETKEYILKRAIMASMGHTITEVAA